MRRSAHDSPRFGRNLVTGLLGLLLISPLWAANPRAVELERQLADAAPAERSRLMVQLSTAIETDDMNRAWEHAQAARREARTTEDEIAADARISALQRRKGDYAAALAIAEAALPRAVALGNDTLRADLLLAIAHTQNSLGDFPAALETFRAILPLAEARQDAAFLARVHNSLGVTYADAGQFDLARKAYETARTHADAAGDRRMVCSLLNNLGNIEMQTGNLEQARVRHEEGLALREALGSDKRGIADSHQNLAELCVLEGHPERALPHLEKAITIHTALGLKRNLTNAHLSHAGALRALGRLDEALGQLQRAQALAESLGTPVISARVYRGFSAYYEAIGDHRRALEFERKLATATEAAVGERSRQRFDALQARFEAERRQHEIDVLRSSQAEQKIKLARIRDQRYGLLALLALGAVALGTIISRHRLKRRVEERILAEARAARDAAEQADALKTRLVGMVSHDIRSPVGNILAMGEELQEDPALTPADPRVEVIVHEARHVIGLAQDLLDVAALETGRLQLQSGPVDLGEVVRATAERLRLAADAKGQKIESEAPAAESVVMGDRDRLGQIIANLVSNAIKYSPRDSTVRIMLSRVDQWVRLSVQDEGPGIPPESRANLFRPFSRLAHQPTGGESSHGLGLSIVHDLVRLHGGSISVEPAPGRGTIFNINLPTAHHAGAM